MISEAKRDANRRNAERSTGPRTPAGKAVAAMNALTHGLMSEKCPVLPTEDTAAFNKLADDLRTHFAPCGPVETELVERAATLTWRLRRCAVVEAGLFALRQAETAEAEASSRMELAMGNPTEAALMSYVVLQDAFAAALDDVQEAKEAQRQPTGMLGAAFRADAGPFATLSRYEAVLDARLTHTLAQLERLQAGRSTASRESA